MKGLNFILKNLAKDQPDRLILELIIKKEELTFTDLFEILVKGGKMAKLTLERHLKSLVKSGFLVKTPGERKGRPVFYYSIGSPLLDQALELVRKPLYYIVGKYLTILQKKGLSKKEIAENLSKAIDQLLDIDKKIALASVLSGLKHKDMKDRVRHLLAFGDLLRTYPLIGMMGLASLHENTAKTLLSKKLRPPRGGGEKPEK